jgi:hypothetical protein
MFATVIGDSAERAVHAITLLVDDAVAVDPFLLLAGVLVHLASQVVRLRGWWNILRASFPGAGGPTPGDVRRAYFAGAGLNSVLPARAGDLVKLAFLHRSIPGSNYATLAATSIPETACETLFGIALVVWMLARGFLPVPATPGEVPAADVSLYIAHPILATALTALAIVAIVLTFRWLRRRFAGIVARLRQGLAIFASPRRFVTGVASWQLLGRIIRLGSLICFLAAFGLPATPGAAMLVMAAQGGGRIVPVAPVSAGLRIAILSYGLVEVTGQPVDAGAVSVFTFGLSAVFFLIGMAISLVLISRELGTANPRTAMRAARARLVASRESSAARAGA